MPLGNDTFAPEGLGDIRIRWIAEPGKPATKLVILGPEGVESESPRDGS